MMHMGCTFNREVSPRNLLKQSKASTNQQPGMSRQGETSMLRFWLTCHENYIRCREHSTWGKHQLSFDGRHLRRLLAEGRRRFEPYDGRFLTSLNRYADRYAGVFLAEMG